MARGGFSAVQILATLLTGLALLTIAALGALAQSDAGQSSTSPTGAVAVHDTGTGAQLLRSTAAASAMATSRDVAGGPRRGEKAATRAADPQDVSFQPAVTYGSGGYIVQGLAIADVNGDGITDVIAENWWGPGTTPGPGVVGVLLGNGDGTFQAAVTYETAGQRGQGVVVADVNGDGIPDLVTASCASTESDCGSGDGVLSVLLGNGDGTFQDAVSYSSGAVFAASVAVSDLRGNGIVDLIAANTRGAAAGDGTVAVLLGKGNGTFQKAVLYDSGAQKANSVHVADLNGDGIPDLVVANLCDSCAEGVVGVLLGNGDGTFQPVVTYASGAGNSAQTVIADVNGDGIPDLIVSNIDYASAYGAVTVLLGLGNGTFAPAVSYSSGGWAAVEVAVADMNGDGKPDIVVANCGPVDGCGTGTIGVLLGNGDGTFQAAMDFSSGVFNATQVAVADLNGDGQPDIVSGEPVLDGHRVQLSAGIHQRSAE